MNFSLVNGSDSEFGCAPFLRVARVTPPPPIEVCRLPSKSGGHVHALGGVNVLCSELSVHVVPSALVFRLKGGLRFFHCVTACYACKECEPTACAPACVCCIFGSPTDKQEGMVTCGVECLAFECLTFGLVLLGSNQFGTSDKANVTKLQLLSSAQRCCTAHCEQGQSDSRSSPWSCTMPLLRIEENRISLSRHQ